MNLGVVISLIGACSMPGHGSGRSTQTSERDIQVVSPLRASTLKRVTRSHPGDPIHLGFAIENVSSSDLWLQPALLHYNVRAVVTDSRGKKVAYKDENRVMCAAPITGKKHLIQLSPNSSVTFNDVTRGLLVLNKPGTYDVSLSYFVVRPELVRALGFRLEPIKAMRLNGIRVVVDSCASRPPILEGMHHKLRASSSQPKGTEFVRIGETPGDPPAVEMAGAVLDREGIPSKIFGSRMYAIYVRRKDRKRAVALLVKDSANHGYFFSDRPRPKPISLSGRKRVNLRQIHIAGPRKGL
jgi:hypothetical protein